MSNEIESLIRLVDDPSPMVRHAIGKRFLELAPDVEDAIDELPERPPRPLLEGVESFLMPWRRRRFREEWYAWMTERLADESDTERLESGLACISQFLSGLSRPRPIDERLDLLADAFAREHRGGDAMRLARYLFRELGFGPPSGDYHSPRHSDLAYVIEERKGLPISLCCVFILVGRRLGLEIEGCNFPRHFLARVRLNDEIWLIDSFQEGRTIREREIIAEEPRAERAIRAFLRAEVPAGVVLARMLRNLQRAFEMREEVESARIVEKLRGNLERFSENLRNARPLEDAVLRDEQPRFAVGQLVRHRRYGYRGVVVDYDLSCRADDAWYRANRTQPDKDQVWYQVLVHRSTDVTYAAQTSLEPDTDTTPVEHPLVEQFFDVQDDGRYVRNQEPFPKT